MSSVGGIPSSRYPHHMRTQKIGAHPAIESPYPPPDTNPRDGSQQLSLAHDRPTVGDTGSGVTGGMAALDSARTVDHMSHGAPPKRIHPARASHLLDAHATGVPTRFTLNTTVLAAGPASAASGDFDDVAAMSRRVAAGIVVPEHNESDVLWWQRRASTDGRLPTREIKEAIPAEGALLRPVASGT